MTDVDAWEYQQQLNKNPEYQKMMAAKDEASQKRIAEIREIEKEFISQWQLNGFFPIESTGNFLTVKRNLNSKMTNFLLTWIPKIDNKHGSQERIVRALVLADKPYEGKTLTDLFDNPQSSYYLKWAIGNTIATGKPKNVEAWLEKVFMALKLGKENEMLVYAIAKYFDYSKAVDLLRKIFDNYPMHAAHTLQMIGTEDDLAFLKGKVKEYKGGAIKASIAKYIKKLEKKLTK